MGALTHIQWCDHSFNGWIGCSKVHEGCTNCYAEREFAHRRKRVVWGPHGTRSVTKTWSDPLKWNRAAKQTGQRPRVFTASISDVLEEWDGPILDAQGNRVRRANGRFTTMDDLRTDLFTLIDSTQNLDWLMLSKRLQNIPKMWPKDRHGDQIYRSNVWLGTSVSNQETFDEYLPLLMSCRQLSPILFLSMEPLLGPITMRRAIAGGQRPDWVIVGGESGPNARPCFSAWVQNIVNECREFNIPCFVKQMGMSWWSGTPEDAAQFGAEQQCSPADRTGSNPDEWPASLRVRQFPVPW